MRRWEDIGILYLLIILNIFQRSLNQVCTVDPATLGLGAFNVIKWHTFTNILFCKVYYLSLCIFASLQFLKFTCLWANYLIMESQLHKKNIYSAYSRNAHFIYSILFTFISSYPFSIIILRNIGNLDANEILHNIALPNKWGRNHLFGL